MNELLLNRFQSDLSFVTNMENYYAMFKHVIEKCANAQLENRLLYEVGLLSDADYMYNVSHIQRAKEIAIKTHGEWTIKMLEHSSTRHTIRTLVSSIYSDIFGIVFNGEG